MGTLLLVEWSLVVVALTWLLWARAPSTAASRWAIAAIGVFVAGAALAGFWNWPTAVALGGLLLLWLGCAVIVTRRSGVPHRAWRMYYIITGLWGSVGVLLCVFSVAGRIPPSYDQLVDLDLPLSGPGFCVVSGGNSLLLNLHRAALQPNMRAWRGQSYGIDVIRIDDWGRRLRGVSIWSLMPTNPSDYVAFGAAVQSPCTGQIIAASDVMADQPVGVVDTARLAGNHIILACAGVEVLLAHLRHGSLRIRTGEQVVVGQKLGEIGNTGNTSEPHLHISAQRRSGEEGWLAGTPVPITIRGRYLARGDCLGTP